jgi:hypothetical protein
MRLAPAVLRELHVNPLLGIVVRGDRERLGNLIRDEIGTKSV